LAPADRPVHEENRAQPPNFGRLGRREEGVDGALNAFMVVAGLICAGGILAIGLLIASAVSVTRRTSWQAQADAIAARTKKAHHQVRAAVTESPRVLRRSLSKALDQAERLMKRQAELRATGIKMMRGLQGLNMRRMQRELDAYRAREDAEANPRVKAQYAHGRKALESQIAHFNALRTKLIQILETMREIQGTVEAMQPRIVRLAMYGVDTGPDLAMNESREVLEELDLFIGELEAFDAQDALLDVDAVDREVKAEAERRLASGQLEFESSFAPAEQVSGQDS